MDYIVVCISRVIFLKTLKDNTRNCSFDTRVASSLNLLNQLWQEWVTGKALQGESCDLSQLYIIALKPKCCFDEISPDAPEVVISCYQFPVQSAMKNSSIWQYFGFNKCPHLCGNISALLALSVGNSPVTGEFPSQRPAPQSLIFFFGLRLNKRLSKQLRRRWFETPSRSL